MTSIDDQIEANTIEFRALHNAKQVHTPLQFLEYLANYGCDYLPDEIALNETVQESVRYIRAWRDALSPQVAILAKSHKDIDERLDHNRSMRIDLQTVRDLLK